jgi:hypothetical protein
MATRSIPWKITLQGGDESTFLAERTGEPLTPIDLVVDGRRSKWERRW